MVQDDTYLGCLHASQSIYACVYVHNRGLVGRMTGSVFCFDLPSSRARSVRRVVANNCRDAGQFVMHDTECALHEWHVCFNACQQ